MPLATRTLCLTIAAIWSIGAAPGVFAAAEPAVSRDSVAAALTQSPNPPGEQLQELDQVIVRGESLLKAIADAEDTFYDLYNKVDKDDKYHTSCVYLNIDPDNPGSQIKSRACIPGFVADAIADWAPFKARCQPPQEGNDEFRCLDRDRNNRLTRDELAVRPELDFEFTTLDADMDNSLDRAEFANASYSATASYQPPPPQLVLMEHSKEWAVHMMKVINSDPRLKDQAGHLDELYHELRSVQQKYTDIHVEGKAEKTTRRELGPRGH
jgi:hypothetical protein